VRGYRGGFLSVAELARELARRTQGTHNILLPESSHTIRYVYRLRALLAKAMQQGESAAEEGGADWLDWAKQLLEYRAFFGYRLSTAPEHLRFVILED
jgi:hypothetical protein